MGFLMTAAAMLVVGLQQLPVDAFSTAPMRTTSRPQRRQFFETIAGPTSSRQYPRSTNPTPMKFDDDDNFPDPHALMEYLDANFDDGINGAGFVSFEEFQEMQRRQQYLRACPIFRDCSDDDLSRIAKTMVLQEVAPGEKLIAQGDAAGATSAMYFLKSGSFQAIGEKTMVTEEETTTNAAVNGEGPSMAAAGAAPQRVVYKTYSKEGDFFGELALVFGQPRAASIVCSSPEISCVYRLDKTAFMESTRDAPVYETAKRMILAKYKSKRLRDVLPKIRLDEVVGLARARLSTPKNRSIGPWLASLRTYSLGAAAAFLITNYIQTVALKPVLFLVVGALAHLL